jgi:hypothetical protein
MIMNVPEREPQKTSTPLVASIIGGAFALLGTLRMPYSYYTTMRLVIAVVCVIMILGAFARRKPLMIAPLACIGIFFLFVKGLSREAWALIDMVTAVGLVGLGGWLSRQPTHD